MNYELLNKKLDQYLAKTSTLEVMQEFESLGYSFMGQKIKLDIIDPFPESRLHFGPIDRPFWKRMLGNRISNSTTPSYSEFFFA
jgi:hypothetical protein